MASPACRMHVRVRFSLQRSAWTSLGLDGVHALQQLRCVSLGLIKHRLLHHDVTCKADRKQSRSLAVRCRTATPPAIRGEPDRGQIPGGTMARNSAASVPLEEPAGMEQEAQLLTSLQEIPNISKCWLRPAQADGLSLTVSQRLCRCLTSPTITPQLGACIRACNVWASTYSAFDVYPCNCTGC